MLTAPMILPREIENISFEGGGPAGIAYAGVLQVLEEKGIQPIRVAGTSAGAIAAVLYSVGYTSHEIAKELKSLDYESFKDSKWGFLGSVFRLFKRYGLYKGDKFSEWIKELIERKTGDAEITFEQLHAKRIAQLRDEGHTHLKDPYLVAADLSSSTPVIFSHEQDSPYSNQPLWYGARCSMSIPGFFAAMKTDDEHWLVDGGLILNDPQLVFDEEKYLTPEECARCPKPNESEKKVKEILGLNPFKFNHHTLAVRLDTRAEINRHVIEPRTIREKIHSIFSYFWSLIQATQSTQWLAYLMSRHPRRSIEIDRLEVRATDFEITPEKIQALIQSGRVCAERFFESRAVNDSLEAQPASSAFVPGFHLIEEFDASDKEADQPHKPSPRRRPA